MSIGNTQNIRAQQGADRKYELAFERLKTRFISAIAENIGLIIMTELQFVPISSELIT